LVKKPYHLVRAAGIGDLWVLLAISGEGEIHRKHIISSSKIDFSSPGIKF